MKYLDRKDLEGVFLIIVRKGKGERAHLPFIRRHFRSVQNICRNFDYREIDIYYSAIWVAHKKPGSKKIVMSEDFAKSSGGQQFFEVHA